MEVVLRVLAFALGALVVGAVLQSAVRTVVVPRGEQVWLTRVTFLATRRVYELSARRRRTYEERERLFARYAPTSLILLPVAWALGIIIGFIPIYWAVGVDSWREALTESGSSFTTLGFARHGSTSADVVAFAEALLGLGMVALLISYLPTIYGVFSRREAEVVKLDVRAGSPPTALEMLSRMQRIGWLHEMESFWAGWEQWFVELEESHVSHPALVFFRSQRPTSSWITAAGAVLDAAALHLTALDVPTHPQAAVTLRAGFQSLRGIAGFYGVPFDPDPAPNDPISIHRQEFDLLLDELEAAGLPVSSDRDQVWRDWAGWRVNYDQVLLALCVLAEAPPTPWSSDRTDGIQRVRLHRGWIVPPPENGPSW